MSDSSNSSLDAIRAGEAAARHALANPGPSDTLEPAVQPAPRRAYPGRDHQLAAEGRDPVADEARNTVRAGAFRRPAGV